MTTINNPATDRFQSGDLVTLSHADLVSNVDVRVNASGNFDLPGNRNLTPQQVRSQGFTFVRLTRSEAPAAPRRNADQIKLVGSVRDGRLTVTLELPSGRDRQLFSGYVAGIGGSQSAVITKADFEG